MRMKLLALMLLAIALIIAGCAKPEEKPQSTPKPEVTPTVQPVTEYASLKDLAEKIRNGEIDVGNDYSMTLNGRFHKIHVNVLGMSCTTCHISYYAKDYLYERKYKVPVRGAPGVVDRGVCLGCHKEGGIATPWYGTASE